MVLQNMFSSLNPTNYELIQFQMPRLHPQSSCVWEHVSIVMQLCFLGVILLQFLRHSCKHRREETDQDAKDYRVEMKVSISYRASLVCSTFLLTLHFLKLLMLFKGSKETQCNSIAKAFSSETMQLMSWATTLIVVCTAPKRKEVKFPWILRAWWICGFLLSATQTALDAVPNGSLDLQDYANFGCLLATTYLLAMSIHGKTGILYAVPNGITEPLLNAKTEHGQHRRESLYGKATLLQQVTFSWINPLFAAGFKKPLENDEIPDLHIKDSAEYASHAFDEDLKNIKKKYGTTHPSIYKAMYLFTRKRAAINALFAVIHAVASYVGPYLIDDFVKSLTEKKTRSLKTGYLLVLAFLGAKMVETIAERQWIFGARQLGIRLKAALISQIYKKGLVLSSQSRQSRTSGEIINYMSVDVQRITDFIWYANTIWMWPIQIFLAMNLLYITLGLASVAALTTTLAVMACNVPITRFQKRYQSQIMDAKDNRMKATSEVLHNMKTIKLQAWDRHFLNDIESLRKIECKWLWKSLRLSAVSAFIYNVSPTFISLVTYGTCMLLGVQLTAGRVLSALATFRLLQGPIFSLPDLLSVIAKAKVSADRVASFLQEEEIQQNAVEYVPEDQTECHVEIESAKFSWDADSAMLTLDDIQLKVKKGMKVAICGTVGSGKSSLLSSILGEIHKLSGSVKISGTKAYVPQSPWILTGTVKENILFGNPHDTSKYDRTVNACALIKDLGLFSGGDLTEIGERGINMSGGQKQRIQIARAVYQDADIYLLDDPFSAVDAHTGRQLFEDCLMGILKDKTILYVTHQVEFLTAADLILVMQNGRIAQVGTFEEMLRHDIGFEALVGAHSEALQSILTIESSSRLSQGPKSNGESNSDSDSNADLVQKRQDSEHNLPPEKSENAGKLVKDEEREKGCIRNEVYWSYLTAVKGGAIVPIILFAQISYTVLQVAGNYWMAWASPTSESESALGIDVILLIYMILSAGMSVCMLVRTALVAKTGIWTAQKLFISMLHNILRSPMAFFDSTPTGRILNRASTDQSVIDLEMAANLSRIAVTITNLLGAITMMSLVAWELFAIFIPVTAICIWYQQYYIPTARELGRLAGIQTAPIFHHFAESLAGAATIRAFDKDETFIEAKLALIDNYSKPWFHNVSAMEWLSFRLNLLTNFVFASSLVVLVTLPEGIINPSIAGLAVTYGINLNFLLAQVLWKICNAENKMISVERVLQYSNLASEAALSNEDCKPPTQWPEVGTICFANLKIRYADHLPTILKNINCTFPGKKKIGVVGRTGSGKSTLIQAMFRIVEPCEGSIIIDNVDIAKIGLQDLRSRLSIIPQDPTMFEGTVRENLDPLMHYQDRKIWEVLDRCQLGDLVRAKEGKLDATVVENGENWSVGQRQLFCLGRALLKKSTILVLDEATASVDSATDVVIQKIITQEFKDRTVVTIAHRIHTVIDSDLVLVLSDGRVAEFDSPAKLLERKDSFFSRLIKEYSTRSKNFNSLVNLQN